MEDGESSMAKTTEMLVRHPPSSILNLLPLPARRLALVMHLRRDVEGRFALAHAAVALATETLLADFHVDRRVEFAAGGDEGFHVLARAHAVDRGAETGAQERV